MHNGVDKDAQQGKQEGEGNQEKALVPIQERRIDFHGDELLVVLVEVEEERQIYVPVRQFCDQLGLNWSAQYRRIERDEVLAAKIICVAITPTQIGQRGYYNRSVLCLPLNLLPGWLFGIMPSRVKPALAIRLHRYRKECFRVFWQALQEGILWQNTKEEDSSDEETYSWTVRARDRIWQACERAIQAQLPATLTVEQWLQTLEYFQWKCAYCRNRPGIIIEHFVPLPLAGTTVENCVPSCYTCNAKKGNIHPNLVESIPRQVLDSIQSYLYSISEQTSGEG